MIAPRLMVRESACVDLQSISAIGSNRTRTGTTADTTRMQSAPSEPSSGPGLLHEVLPLHDGNVRNLQTTLLDLVFSGLHKLKLNKHDMWIVAYYYGSITVLYYSPASVAGSTGSS